MGNQGNDPQVFCTKIKIRFRDADPAGILFFGNVLGLAHDVFEEFIVANGISWNEWFKASEWACPIRHSEVDYLFPFSPGQDYDVEAKVQKVGQSSLGMHYEFRNSDNKICARVQMVHTFVDQKTFQKIDVPDKYRILFEKFL